jgi:hypothetical protein
VKGYEMNLKEMTKTELQSLCYEQILVVNQAQNNINIIQAELAKRAEADVQVPDSSG